VGRVAASLSTPPQVAHVRANTCARAYKSCVYIQGDATLSSALWRESIAPRGLTHGVHVEKTDYTWLATFDTVYTSRGSSGAVRRGVGFLLRSSSESSAD